MDSFLRDLSLPRERLAEYLEYLGLSYKELELHYGVGASTWHLAATSSKKASSIIMNALSDFPPPPGKVKPDMNWLLSGVGAMLPITGTIAVTDQPDTAQAQGQVGPIQSIPTRVAYERQATLMVIQGIKEYGLEDISEKARDRLIDVTANGLVVGRSPAEIEEQLRDFLDAFAKAHNKESQ